MKSILEKNKSIKVKMAANDDQIMHDEDLSVYEDNDCENSDDISNEDEELTGQDSKRLTKQTSGYKVIKQMEDSRCKQRDTIVASSSKNYSNSWVGGGGSETSICKRMPVNKVVIKQDPKHNAELKNLLN